MLELVGVKHHQNILYRMQAAEVLETVKHFTADFREAWMQLKEIHAAPEWLWPVLVQHLIADEWTIDTTKKHINAVKKNGHTALLG